MTSLRFHVLVLLTRCGLIVAHTGGMNGGISALSSGTGHPTLFWGIDAGEAGPHGQILSMPAVAGATPTVLNGSTINSPTGVAASPLLHTVMFGNADGVDATIYEVASAGGDVTTRAGPPNVTGLSVSSTVVVPGSLLLVAAMTGPPGTPFGLYTLDLRLGDWQPFNTQQLAFPSNLGVAGTQSTLPKVTQVSPTHGPHTANTTVYVIGAGFKPLPALACMFGRKVVVHATYRTTGVVSCVAPPSPEVGPIIVQVTNDGTDYSWEPVEFTYT